VFEEATIPGREIAKVSYFRRQIKRKKKSRKANETFERRHYRLDWKTLGYQSGRLYDTSDRQG